MHAAAVGVAAHVMHQGRFGVALQSMQCGSVGYVEQSLQKGCVFAGTHSWMHSGRNGKSAQPYSSGSILSLDGTGVGGLVGGRPVHCGVSRARSLALATAFGSVLGQRRRWRRWQKAASRMQEAMAMQEDAMQHYWECVVASAWQRLGQNQRIASKVCPSCHVMPCVLLSCLAGHEPLLWARVI